MNLPNRNPEIEPRIGKWGALGIALGISFPLAVIAVNLLHGKIPYGTISVFSLLLLVWAAVAYIRRRIRYGRWT